MDTNANECLPLGEYGKRTFRRIQNFHADLQMPETKLLFKKEIQLNESNFLDGDEGFAVSTLKSLNFKDILSGKTLKNALKDHHSSIAIRVTLLLITLATTIVSGYMILKKKYPNFISKPARGRYSILFEAFAFVLCLTILSVAVLATIETTLNVNNAISRNAQLAKDTSEDLVETVDIFRDQVADIESNIFALYYDVEKFLICASMNHTLGVRSALQKDLSFVFDSSAHALGSLIEATGKTGSNFGLYGSYQNVRHKVLSIQNTIAVALKNAAKLNETRNGTCEYIKEVLLNCSAALNGTSMVNETDLQTSVVNIKQKINSADRILKRKLKIDIDDLIFDLYKDVVWQLRLNKDRMRRIIRYIRGYIKDVLMNELEYKLDDELMIKKIKEEEDIKNEPSRRLRLCVLLFPSVYLVLTYLMLFVSAASSFYVIQRRHSLERSERLFAYCTLTKKMFQVSLIFGVSLLLIVFLCASLAFLMSILLSVICQPLADGTIFQDYNGSRVITVQFNITFIDKIFEDNFNASNQQQSNVRSKEILEKCFRNSSIFVASGLINVLNISDCVIGESLYDLLNKNDDTIRTYLDVSSVELFEREMKVYGDIYHAISVALNAIRVNNLTKLTSDTYNIDASSMVEKLFDLVWSLPIEEPYLNTRKNLQKILIELESIQNESFPQLKADLTFTMNLEKLMEIAKVSLKFSMESLERLNATFTELIPKLSVDIRGNLLVVLHALNSLSEDVSKGLRDDVGMCYVLPLAFENMRWTVCDNALALVNSTWLTLSVTGFIITILLLTGYRLNSRLSGFLKDKRK